MKTAKRRSPMRHDSPEFMSKVELALNFARMAIQENRFKSSDLVNTFGMPTNFTKAANDLGIFVNESASSRHPSWNWILEGDISSELAEQVALTCKEMKRIENEARNRSKVKVEAEPQEEPKQEEPAKAEVVQLPLNQELFDAAANDPSIELLKDIKSLLEQNHQLHQKNIYLQTQNNQILEQIANSWK